MQLNCLVLGPPSSGKTSFIQRLTTGNFTCDWNRATVSFTADAQGNSTVFHTNKGQINFTFFETLPQDIKMNCAVILMPKTSITKDNGEVKAWIDKAGSQPKVLCGNKVDIVSDVDSERINKELSPFIAALGVQYYDFSSLSMYNIDKPCLYLMRTALNMPDLHFIKASL